TLWSINRFKWPHLLNHKAEDLWNTGKRALGLGKKQLAKVAEDAHDHACNGHKLNEVEHFANNALKRVKALFKPDAHNHLGEELIKLEALAAGSIFGGGLLAGSLADAINGED